MRGDPRLRRGPGGRGVRAFDARAARLFAAFDAPVMRAPRPSLPRLAAQVAASPALAAAMAPFRSLAGSLGAAVRRPAAGAALRALCDLCRRLARRDAGAAGADLARRGARRLAGRGRHAPAGAGDRGAGAGAGRAVPLRHRGAADRGRAAARSRAVRLADGRRLAADAVVFNGDPAALVGGLLGDGAGARRCRRRRCSRGRLSAYVWSFAAPAPAFALGHHNVFFARRSGGGVRDIGRGPDAAGPDALRVRAGPRDAGRAPGGVGAVRDHHERARGTGAGGAGVRDMSGANPWSPVADGARDLALPGREGLTTPDGLRGAVSRGRAGRSMAAARTGWRAAFRRPTARSAIPGLYLAGGGVHPGPGMPMATLSGGLAAAAILADLDSTSRSRRTAMRGGTSTDSRRTASARSPSSAS